MRRIMLLAAALAVVAVPAVALAQEAKPAEGRNEVTLTWDQFVKITGYDPAKKTGQVLTIPWSEVESLLGVKIEKVGPGATVDLPWNEFKALLEWSVKRKEKPAETPPPTDWVVVSSDYTGTLSEDKGDFVLTLKLDILRKDGWKRIPVLPANVAITKSTLPKDVYLHTQDGFYELLTAQSGPVEATLAFSVAAQKEAGISRIDFQRLLTGSAVVDLTVPGTDVEVKLPGAQAQTARKENNNTRVAAALPGAVPFMVTVERALPTVPPAPPKLYVETRTLVAVGEGMLLCNELLNYNILHSGVRELKLQVPADAAVMTVAGQNVQDWRVTPAGEMTVTLRGEAVGAYSLNVNYEQPAKDTVQVPVIRAQDVERERGYIGVIALANVEVDAGSPEGASRIDVRQLPGEIVGMTNQPILLAFRYLGADFTIPLNIKRHGEIEVLMTIVDAGCYTAMQLSDGRRITKVTYTVRNKRAQFLRLTMPKDADIWSVSVGGTPAGPAKDDEGNVLIPLVRSRLGATELSSFPVEMVYVEKPAKAPGRKGTLHVDLPSLTVPAMHVMYTIYLPKEGDYTVGWGRLGFSGPMRLVEHYASLAAEQDAAGVKRIDATKQAQSMQQDFDARFAAEVKQTGATPIRVRLPLNGKCFMLERILVLPGDRLWFDVKYSKWDVEE